MNKENMLRLADVLENEIPDEEFTMEFFWQNNCGCIAGHAARLLGRVTKRNHEPGEIILWAEEFLGMSDLENAGDLFPAFWTSKFLREITRQEAVRALRLTVELNRVPTGEEFDNG